MNDSLSQTAMAVTKALGYAENGGAPNPNSESAGKTGELKSIFQFEPATWKKMAKEYLGDANAPLTPDNETTVVYKNVSKELNEGYTIKQIASEWNSGDKDAYTGKFSSGSPSIGTNEKYGVKYNVPAYANTVNSYAQQFMSQSGNNAQVASSQTGPGKTQALQKILSIIQQAKQSGSTQPAQNSGLLGQAASAMNQPQPSTGALPQAAQGVQPSISA